MGEIHHRSLSSPIKTLTGAQEELSGVDILPANSMGGHFAGQTFGGGEGWLLTFSAGRLRGGGEKKKDQWARNLQSLLCLEAA